MVHDRIHAQRPSHDRQAYDRGEVIEMAERDGHAVVTVQPADGTESVELRLTLAVRDLFVSRLDDAPVGSTVWYRTHGARS